MNTELNRDLMIAMLRKGSTGDEMLNILNVIVPDSDVDAVVNEDVVDVVEVAEDADTMEDVIVEDAELAVV